MKGKILRVFFLVAVLMSASCTKMLDIKNADGRVDLQKDVFGSKSKAGDYFHICLNTVMNVGFVYDGAALASFSDEAYDASAYANGAIMRWYYDVTSPSNNPLLSYMDYWEHYFQGIRRCNTFLLNMNDPDIATGDYSEQERKGWIAQIHVARAYFYLQLIKRYGGVPIIETPYEMTHDFSNDFRASFEDCVDFIIDDCNEALAHPEPEDQSTTAGFWWVRKGGQNSYMSRAAAWAIKSQAALYASSPLWYESGSKYNWTKTAEITKEALDQCLAHGYRLYNAPADPKIAQNAYAMYFMGNSMPNNTWEKETFLQTRDNRTEVWKMAGLPTTNGMEKAGAGPTQELVDSYEVYDGTNAYPLLNLANPYADEKHLLPNINPEVTAAMYDPTNPYNNRDPRFYASIYYNGAHHVLSADDTPENRVYTHTTGNSAITTAVNDIRHTRTGYYMRKYNRSTSNINANDDGFMRLLRLGELYLNFAEAAYNSTGDPYTKVASTVSGQSSMSASDAVNAIRVRAGMPALPVGMTKGDFELRYRNERRVELAFEEHRFFDVRRWKILSKTDGYKTGMMIDGGTFTRFNLESGKSPTSGDKYLMFPINQSEVAKMVKFTGDEWQNPDW